MRYPSISELLISFGIVAVAALVLFWIIRAAVKSTQRNKRIDPPQSDRR